MNQYNRSGLGKQWEGSKKSKIKLNMQIGSLSVWTYTCIKEQQEKYVNTIKKWRKI